MATSPRMPARDLVLAFFHAASDRSLDVATLLAATAVLGLTGNSTRVALSRLGAEGWVLRDERGRYRLRSERAAAASGICSFKAVPSALAAWKGHWIACFFETGRKHELPESLRRLGFRSPSPAFAVRPDNLRGGVELLESRLGEARFFRLTALGTGDAAADWPALWDSSSLNRGYAQMRTLIRKSRAKLSKLTADAQLAETFAVVQPCIARLEQDPLLPDRWIDAESRARLVEELAAYDQEARVLWMRRIPGLELEGSLRAASTDWKRRATA